MKRDGFLFYRSFYDAIRLLPEPGDRLRAYEAIMAYALDDEPMDRDEGVWAAMLTLIRPVLDASKRKAESGRRGGEARAAALRAAGGGEAIKDKGCKIKDEGPETGTGDGFAAVEAAFRQKITPAPSGMCLDELRELYEAVGPEVCIRAMDAALDEGKGVWSYVRAILRDKQRLGIRTLADWDRQEAERRRGRSREPEPAAHETPSKKELERLKKLRNVING